MFTLRSRLTSLRPDIFMQPQELPGELMQSWAFGEVVSSTLWTSAYSCYWPLGWSKPEMMDTHTQSVGAKEPPKPLKTVERQLRVREMGVKMQPAASFKGLLWCPNDWWAVVTITIFLPHIKSCHFMALLTATAGKLIKPWNHWRISWLVDGRSLKWQLEIWDGHEATGYSLIFTLLDP